MVSHDPSENGPFLTGALICEKILHEKDGVLSLVRIVDRVLHTTIGQDPPESMKPFKYNFMFYIAFKSGSAQGVRQLKVVMIKPSGEKVPPLSRAIDFKGEEDEGTAMLVELNLTFDLEGLYWFDVELDDTLLTRVPLRVVYTHEFRQPLAD